MNKMPGQWSYWRSMSRVNSWEVSDVLWSRVEPLIPVPERDPTRIYRRKPGAGRKPLSARRVFAGILYVLRTGCHWKAVPRCFGSGSAIHAYFQESMQKHGEGVAGDGGGR